MPHMEQALVSDIRSCSTLPPGPALICEGGAASASGRAPAGLGDVVQTQVEALAPAPQPPRAPLLAPGRAAPHLPRVQAARPELAGRDPGNDPPVVHSSRVSRA